MKKALITGITGQDGYFLTKLLLNKNYEVHGIYKNNLGLLTNLSKNDLNKIKLHKLNIINEQKIKELFNKYRFNEIYHLAAQSSVYKSIENPYNTYLTNIIGSKNIINNIKKYSNTKMFFAASSEMFGDQQNFILSETNDFLPKSPYAISKLCSYFENIYFRNNYDLFISNGILFNHTSEYRPINYIDGKIAHYVAQIKLKKRKYFTVGNINVMRDWGYAPDYVEAMWKILQHDKPDDFIIATGEAHSIKEFIEIAFKTIDINIEWKNKGINTYGINKKDGQILVKTDPKLYRTNDLKYTCGNSTKAKKILKWRPKTNFKDIIKKMIIYNINHLKK